MCLLILSILLSSSCAGPPTQGKVGVDCNRESRARKSAGPALSEFDPRGSRLATYPAAPLKDRSVTDWAYVRTFTANIDHHVLPFIAEAAIYEFGRASPDGMG